MDLTLHVWRQNGPKDKGRFETLPARASASICPSSRCSTW